MNHPSSSARYPGPLCASTRTGWYRTIPRYHGELEYAKLGSSLVSFSVETWSGDDNFGKVRSNGFNHPGFPLSNLFDGNKDSLYISRIDPFVNGAYVDVDFDEPVVIKEIILTTRTKTIHVRDRWELSAISEIFLKYCLRLY